MCVCVRARPCDSPPVEMRLCDACRISSVSITPFISRLSQSPQLPHDDTHSRIEHYASRYTLHSRHRHRRAQRMHPKCARECGPALLFLHTCPCGSAVEKRFKGQRAPSSDFLHNQQRDAVTGFFFPRRSPFCFSLACQTTFSRVPRRCRSSHRAAT